MKKVYLTGSNGMLGYYCRSVLDSTDYEVTVATRDRFDLSDPNRCYDTIKKFNPDVIVHLAAETNVDLCEANPAHAALYNYMSTGAIAKAANDTGSKLIYVSTSNVYGKEGKVSYNELDLPCPLNYYGMSKLAGENAVKKHLPHDSLIIRAGWMIGGGVQRDHKFVGKIIQQIKSKNSKTISAVADKFGSITPANKLAKFIAYCIENSILGTLHYASEGVVSRYDIAKFICSKFDPEIVVSPVKSALFPLAAPRPTFESIHSVILPSLVRPPVLKDWNTEIEEYILNFDL